MLKAGDLEYEIRGAGEPVLLIHGGFICDSDVPLMSEPALARYRLVRYHRRGYAGSARHTGPFSIADQANDARTVLRELGVERAHVVGHSYGGLIALQLALDAPEVPRSLVLSEPAAMRLLQPAAPTSGTPAERSRERYAAGNVMGALDAFLDVVAGPNWRAEVPKMLPGAPAQVEKDAATAFEVEFPAIDEWRFDAQTAKRISQPVLSLIGTGGERPLVHQVRKLLHDLLPQTEDFDVDGANHMLQSHSPRSASLVATGIATFLARHPI